MAKMTYQDFRALLDTVTDQTPGDTNKAHYALGAFECIIADIGRNLSAAKQADLARSIEALAIRLKNY